LPAAICETAAGVFPPEGNKTPAKEWNLWKELKISLVSVSMPVPGALDMGKDDEKPL
jgi:hypothetical protein